MSYENGEKKSSGVAKAGLTLGIIGTGLASLGILGAGNGFPLLGGWNGNFNNFHRGHMCGEDEFAALKSEIARLRSEKYTDAVGIDLYKNIVATAKEEDAKIGKVQADMLGYVIDLDKRVALNAQAQELNRQYDTMARDYQMTILNNKLDCCCEKMNAQMCFNNQINDLTSASIISYINSNFIAGRLYMPASSITPPVALA